MLKFTEFLLEDEKKFHYDLGHKAAMAGEPRGETSDNYGPYASHYDAGYDAGRKKRKNTEPNVVGKDSYGRDIMKVEMRGPQRGSQDRIQTAAQKRKEQEFNKRAGIIEPEEAPSSFSGSTKPKSYYRSTGNR